MAVVIQIAVERLLYIQRIAISDRIRFGRHFLFILWPCTDTLRRIDIV